MRFHHAGDGIDTLLADGNAIDRSGERASGGGQQADGNQGFFKGKFIGVSSGY
ncbi:hypothetical protein ACFSQE_16480 [Vogesella fluminis]|uniref:hypothetical protein n=1 Tax=Vogesella fluminis TaxID=1069161 RepID=UPI00362F0614